ncbi:MAG: ATP-binding protein [Pontiella sp.]
MLIEFKVENYLSYRDAKTLSMLASRQVSEFVEANVIPHERTPLLKSAVIYGANASGKSNLLAAMTYMRWFIINSSKEGQADEPIDVSPFKLDTATENKPCHFEVTFLLHGTRYRYGFQADRTAVVSEWLFEAKKEKEQPMFLRDGDGIDVRSGFSEGKELENKTRDNALFLSVVANFNGELSGKVIAWFRNLTVAHGLREQHYARVSATMVQDVNRKTKLIELIRRADLGIEDIIANEEEFDTSSIRKLFTEEVFKEFSQNIPLNRISLTSLHTKFSDGIPDGVVSMKFEEEESEGTQKFFRLAGPILESLEKGSILVVDELEAKLHPLLTRMIVRLYHSDVSNPKGAQLIFATHDTNLLEHVKFRRDQIWFAEKDRQQATDLYSLAEIKVAREDGSDQKVRKDARYEKDYFKGKYGAVPYLGEFEKLLMQKDPADG